MVFFTAFTVYIPINPYLTETYQHDQKCCETTSNNKILTILHFFIFFKQFDIHSICNITKTP